LFAGLIEFHDELFFSKRGTHYLKGGIPGKNMVPGLYDPLGLSKNKSPEQLARGRDSEIKNGRLVSNQCVQPLELLLPFLIALISFNYRQ
jgi:hypothetical protein